MPLQDWTLVKSGTYYNLHFHWLAALTDRLNAGVLPPGFFAMIEQRVGGPEPDVIKTHRIAIHHDLGTVVAVIELVSPGNKDTKHALRSFARKSGALLRNNIHLLVIDPFPPGRYDPDGIHKAVWSEVTTSDYRQPADKPLTLVSYQAGEVPTAYIEPMAVGTPLPDMSLFLDEEYYVNVPLDETYQATWAVLPKEIRCLVEPPG